MSRTDDHEQLNFHDRLNEDKFYHVTKDLYHSEGIKSLLLSCEILNELLLHDPWALQLARKDETLVRFLKAKQSRYADAPLLGQLKLALMLLGQRDDNRRDGIKILAIDGGGMRGLVAIDILKKIEEECKKPAYQLFDYICGTSTGAIISFLLGLVHQTASTCEKDYKNLSKAIFKRNLVFGTSMLFLNQSYYDTDIFEKAIKAKIDFQQQLIQTMSVPNTPKVAAIATLVSGPRPIPYVFRNYCHTQNANPNYPGTYDVRPWEAVRASAAAPGYFQDYKISNNVFLDGGLLSNNPAAVALHECKLLWPDIPIKCLVSIGTGYHHRSLDRDTKFDSSLSNKFRIIIDSATDTLKVHNVLKDMLPAGVYYRFNPPLSKPVAINESREDFIKQMQEDTRSYIKANTSEISKVNAILQDTSKRSIIRTLWKFFRR